MKETVRAVQWLHNETMFAAAQKRTLYIYDQAGTEACCVVRVASAHPRQIHVLDKHIDVNRLEFLPYHFLLASVGNAGYLKYQDTSTGRLVGELRTKLGPCDVMRQNPSNASAYRPVCVHFPISLRQSSTWATWAASSRCGHPTWPRPLSRRSATAGLCKVGIDCSASQMA